MAEGQGQLRSQGSVRLAVEEHWAQMRRNAERYQKSVLGIAPDDELPPYIVLEYPKGLYPLDPNADPVTVETAAEEKQMRAEGYASYAEAKAVWDEPIPLEYDPAEELVEAGPPEAKPKRKR